MQAGDTPQRKRPRAPKDVDSATRAQLFFASSWLLPALIVIGVFTAGASHFVLGLSPIQSLLVGLAVMLGGSALFYVVVYKGVIGGTASFLGSIYGGSRTPAQRAPAYSRAQALAKKGSRIDALAVLEAEVVGDPGNPGPYLAAATIALEEAGDPHLAADWFRRARGAERITAETSAYVCLRLAEIYEAVEDTGRASVELRRLIELYPDSPYTELARGRLRELKSQRADSDGETFRVEGS